MKADNIRALLKSRGYSQKDLAESLGVSPNGLKKMFDNDSYKVSTLERIAKYLSVEVSELTNQTKVGLSANEKQDITSPENQIFRMSVKIEILEGQIKDLQRDVWRLQENKISHVTFENEKKPVKVKR